MTAQYVTLTLDLNDGAGNQITQGYATFVPSVEVAGAGLVVQNPITAMFRATGTAPTVSLLAQDSPGLSVSGWTWQVTFTDVPGNPASFSFLMTHANGANQNLSTLVQVPAVTPVQSYLPLPSGTPTAGQIPIATGSGEGSAWTNQPMGMLAATPAAGFTLVNGTPTIFTWTAPNDGNLHRIQIIAMQHVTSAETGGTVMLDTLIPDGTAANPTVFAGTLGAGVTQFNQARLVEAGSTVTLLQSSALTAGAAVVWAELWGS